MEHLRTGSDWRRGGWARNAWPSRPLILLALVTLWGGCDRGPSQAPATPAPTRVEGSPPGTPPGNGGGFSGIASMIAGANHVHIRWDPVASPAAESAAFRYRVYTSSESGDQDFANPRLMTEPGIHEVTLPAEPGESLFCVVRSVDARGREDENELEWCATARPVLHVNGAVAEICRAVEKIEPVR